jgi:RND family efflux transporter MFP subunit
MAVTSGQVLARLDDADALAALRAVEAEREVYRSELARLEVELENARRNLERQRELRARDLNTEQELDDAQTAAASLGVQVESARRRIEAAERSVAISRQNLENCTIRAPFGGIVVSKDAQPGEMVSPISAGGGYTRTGIATVVDMASLEIEVDVNESYIARVAPGQRVEALLDAYPDWSIPSRVRTVIPTADRQKATVKVRISFDSLDPRILPDMGVKVSFLEERPDSTAGTPKALVPKGALRRENGAAYLFVLREGTLERRAVKAGRELGSEIEIVAGLRGGERVVISGTEALHDGQRVSVRE